MGKEETKSALEKLELRKVVTVGGSYMLDYAYVEFDIYAALGMGAFGEQALREML
jgi:hypothetical protein